MKKVVFLVLILSSITLLGQDVQLESAKKKYNEKNFKGAKDDLTSVLNSNPKNKQALVLRGQARIALEDYYGGIGDFNFALESDSTLSDAYYYRGEAKMALGDLEAHHAKLVEPIRRRDAHSG